MAKRDLDFQKLINDTVQKMVFMGYARDDLLIKLEAASLNISTRELKRKITEFICENARDIEPEQINLYFKGNINKLIEIIHCRRGTQDEKTRAIKALNDTIKLYLETRTTSEDTPESSNNKLLESILGELYSTPEGIELVERAEAQLNI
jgi:hypothetical protein